MAYSVSIILPTINEEENLKLLIPDLIENLDGIDYSIIVADDGSSDNSKEYVESLNLVHKNIIFKQNFTSIITDVNLGWD